MNINYSKKLFFLVIFSLLTLVVAAQTITIGSVDGGSYGQGSTISVPIVTSGCLSTTNAYKLYLSDANGNFDTQKEIGSISGFYATFINGIIPAGTTAGSGYKVRVISTAPVVTSTTSAAFAINNTTGVVAGVSSQLINPQYPEVFGTCNNSNANGTTSYTFLNESSSGASATVTFFNDLSHAAEGTAILSPGTQFNAKAANYTVTVKAVSNGIIGTKSFLLLNNVVNSSFGVTGNSTICLSKNGGGDLTFNVDIISATGIQNNYPGTIYNIQWGDGVSSMLTLCDIIAQGGKVSHTYTKSSCGNNITNGPKNVFQVTLQPTSSYCGNVVSPVLTYAKIIAPPENRVEHADAACVNTPVTFNNTSYPGEDPSTNSSNCINPNALYSWYVDNDPNPKVQNYGPTQPFVYTFSTTGKHTVKLVMQNPAGSCAPDDFPIDICIQNPPKPIFNFPVKTGCGPSLTLVPANTSIIDASCDVSNFSWTVTGPAPVNFAANTDATSAEPHFVFNKAGVYRVNLVINTKSCGPVTGTEQIITVDDTPVATLSDDATICGINQTFKFDNSPGTTHTTLTGIGELKPDSYVWTVTGGAFEFTGGTTANSQYPQILFKDAADYTITVVTKNDCGAQPATDTQHLNFQQSPTITATADQTTICAGTIASLTGNVTSGTISGQQWSGGAGPFSNPNALVTTYTPTAADIAAGKVTLVLTANTSLPAPCDKVISTVTVTIEPQNSITSPSIATTVCSGTAVNYHIEASKPNSNFSWTVDPAKTSAFITGYASSGSGTDIKDILTNTDAQNAGVVTYVIQAIGGNCNGNSFSLTVPVAPNKITAGFTPDITEGCGSVTVQFNNTSSPLANSSFTWDFGDNTTSTEINPQHTFEPDPDGKDKIYTVSLLLTNACGIVSALPVLITVRPQTPVALIKPGQLTACAPFVLTVDNKSPGTNKSYTYYLYDGTDLVQSIILTDKSAAVFNALNPATTKQYKLYMVAEGFCNNTQKSIEWPITVSPPTFDAITFIKDNQNKGCYPFTTSFVNASTGGEKFVYNIYDKDGNAIDHKDAGPLGTILPYTFTQPGTFYVSISAANNCSQIESDKSLNVVEVYPLPIPGFSADATTGCKNLLVTFNNETQAPDGNTQASSYSYDWDFGDGSPHALVQNPPAHWYKYSNSPYTVTLVVTNLTTSCTATLSKNALITVDPPSFTAFSAKPDSVINIPNYSFSFVDQTTGGANGWKWDFGDGQTSNNQNPEHTYRDTGIYKVTLTTTKGGCDSTITHKVRITGIPGQLYLPNAFMPTSGTTELQKFIAKGSGIKTWHLQIFNNYGQLMWETSKLTDPKGTPVDGDGWDGTFKGTPVQQGVYIWQASATFINGTEWKGMSYNNSLPKRTGTINLIR
jgi:PKD repeat protein